VMTNEDLVRYLEGLGLKVEVLNHTSGKWIVICDFRIASGALRGQTCDVAVLWSPQVPYVAPSAIQVRPHVVAMGTRNAQQSPLGQDWQYLSRVLRGNPTPKAWLVHINTIFAEL